jgi:orotate phosphoribosyltransferase-like protein
VAEIEYTKNLQSPAQFQRGDSLTVRGATVTELVAALAEAKGQPEFAAFFVDAVVVQDVTDEDKPLTDIEAIANIEKHLGKPASPAQIAVAAKKSGKTVEELTGISEERAKELIKKGAA